MRYSILQMAVILILYLFALQTGYALSIDIVDKLDIKAIKSIDLTFKDGNGKEIYLGNTQPAEILFPASQEGSEKFTEEMLDVNVGKNEAQTIARLLLMFNLIGNPDSES